MASLATLALLGVGLGSAAGGIGSLVSSSQGQTSYPGLQGGMGMGGGNPYTAMGNQIIPQLLQSIQGQGTAPGSRTPQLSFQPMTPGTTTNAAPYNPQGFYHAIQGLPVG